MNQIRAIQALNKKEIDNGISPDASWHADYRDTAFIYFGDLPYELSEGDVVTIFSQFGEPVFLKLVRDKETGKSKGFGWLKYEDQRSTDLAVDNLGGAEIGGRLIRVDHARYKARDDEDQDEFNIGWENIRRKEGQLESEDEISEAEVVKPMLAEERELALLMQEHDDDDPMKGFLLEEKKKEVEAARRRAEKKVNRHKHTHHRHHKSRRDDGDDGRHKRWREDEKPTEREHHHRDGSRDPHRRHRDRDRDESRDGKRRRDRKDYDDNRERTRGRTEQEDSEEARHRRRHRGDDDHSERKPRRRSRSR